MLMGDWNAYHSSCSLSGSLRLGGRVLAYLVEEQGAELYFGEGGTFKRRRNG